MSTFTFSLTIPTVLPSSDAAPLAHESDHEGVGVGRLLHQFVEKPRIEAFLRRLLEQAQSAEDVCWQLATERFLDPVPTGEGPAIGAQLDVIGVIVGETRGQRLDDEYRTFLRVRILINNSDGKTEDLLAILDLIGFETIQVEDVPIARIRITVSGAVYVSETNRLIREAKAAGVGLLFVYTSLPLNEIFQLSHTYDATESGEAATGLGSSHGVTGGKLLGALQ